MNQDKVLKIGLLETGRPPPDLEQHGDYPTMFEQLLSGADENLKFERWAVLDDELPTDVNTCDAWLITGSRHGAYEDHSWIDPLMTFVRDAQTANIPMVGICFGHQLIAQALGGKVEKSDKGWGVSVHSYDFLDKPKPSWMQTENTKFDIQCFHQDQVIELPVNANVIAGSEFCPYAMVSYGDQALTFQGHPEFDSSYGEGLIDMRRDLLGDEITDAGLEVVHQPIDSTQVAQWIVGFIRARKS